MTGSGAMDCSTCHWSNVDVGDADEYPDGPLLRCHRFPPQIFVLEDRVSQTLPNVGPGDWCAEHVPEAETEHRP